MFTAMTSILAALIPVTAEAAGIPSQFAPNHVFVTCSGGRVVEFDPDGNFVRSIAVAGSTAKLSGLAFGPDGMLYVARADNGYLLRVEPDGKTKQTGVYLLGVNDLTTNGTGGFLAVDSDARTIFDIGFDSILQPELGTATVVNYGIPNAVEVASDGSWYVAAAAYGSKAAGIKKTFPHAANTSHEKPAVAPSALVLEVDGFIAAEMYGEGLWIGSMDGPVELAYIQGDYRPDDLARNADGQLLASCKAANRILELNIDGTVEKQWTHDSLVSPHRIAVAPQVFDIVMKGRVVESDEEKAVVVKETARLLVAPHSGSMFLRLPPKSFLDPELSGSIALNLRGETSQCENAAVMIRGCGKIDHAGKKGLVSIEVELKGGSPETVGVIGKSVRGTLQASYESEGRITSAMLKLKGKRDAED